MKEQVLKLLNDRKFCDELLKLENENEVKEHFKKNGVEITDEELLEIKEFISVMEKELKKLDNDVLKEISGGVGEDKAVQPASSAVTDKKERKAIDTIRDIDEGMGIISKWGSYFRGFADYVCNQIHIFNQKECDNKVEMERVRQEGKNARYNAEMNTIMGLAITAAIAGGIYVNRRRICKWIFGS